MGDLVESDGYAIALAACVTGQRPGWPHTSGSHIRQMTRLAVASVVSAPSMRSSIGAEGAALAGIEGLQGRGDGVGARAERGVGGAAAGGREPQGDSAPVAGAAVALDQSARLQAVGEAHDGGVRERERPAQQVQRLALCVVAQGDQRGGIAARHAGAGVHGGAGAVGQGQRQRAEEVGRAVVTGHRPDRAARPGVTPTRRLVRRVAGRLDHGDAGAAPATLTRHRGLAEDLHTRDLVAAVAELADEAQPAQLQPRALDDPVGVLLAAADDAGNDDERRGVAEDGLGGIAGRLLGVVAAAGPQEGRGDRGAGEAAGGRNNVHA